VFVGPQGALKIL